MLFIAAGLQCALACSPSLAAQRRLEVLPVIFVPSDNREFQKDKVPEYFESIYRHLVLAQRHWQNILETDTFAISPHGFLYYGKQPHSYYVPSDVQPDGSDGLGRKVRELFTARNDNRVDSLFVYLILYARPSSGAKVGPQIGGGRTFNGRPNTGGGAVELEFSSLLTDTPYPFQSTIVHELGHAFGLTHPNCHGYDLSNNNSAMSYNLKHHSRGLIEGPVYSGLNPEDYFVIGQNKLAFPNFRYLEATHNPTHKPLKTIERCYLGPMSAYIGVDQQRKLHGIGYELFFNGKLVSGPEAPFMSRNDAQASCEWNKKNNPQVKMECRFFGLRFGP